MRGLYIPGMIKKNQYIENLREGDAVNEIFAAKTKNPPRTYKKGTMFGVTVTDKTGEIKVNLKEAEFAFNKDDLINIIGFLNITLDGEKEVEAEIIQDMTNLNFDYYQKIYEIKKTLI